MKLFRTKRLKAAALAALFAVAAGFGAAQADSPYAEGCSAKPGCTFGGERFGGCCVDP